MSFQIPGYSYDPIKRRYFKTPPGQKPPDAVVPSFKDQSMARPPNKGKGKRRASDNVPFNTAPTGPINKPRRSLHSILMDPEGVPKSSSRYRRKLCFTHAAYSLPSTSRLTLPSHLAMGENITTILPSPYERGQFRVGGDQGSIGIGYLDGFQPRMDQEEADFLGLPEASGEAWRREWQLSSAVTSLSACGARTVATALGAPSECVISSASDTVSLASVSLRPPRTSIWCSSISPSCIAIGCDDNVLTTTDPGRHTMQPYPTGSAVYTIEQNINTIIAGTRGGTVLVFDRRSTKPQIRYSHGARLDRQTSPVSRVLEIDGAVTHLRLLGQHQILVAGTANHLALYDLRFVSRQLKPRPLLSFPGHVNAYLRELGLSASASDLILAAAGQDCKIRLWSLRDGVELKTSFSDRCFGSGPVKALYLVDDYPSAQSTNPGTNPGFASNSNRGPPWRGPGLVIADGPMLECTGAFG